jgi:protein-S-isoprenylcysteine O-methyltransferase Ste14
MLGSTIILYKKRVIGTSTQKLVEIIIEYILVPVLSPYIILTAIHIELPNIFSNNIINMAWLQYVGVLFCYIGLIIFFMALLSFGKEWKIGIDEQNSNVLIPRGIFKYSRNPIILFMDLYFIGIMLIYPTVVFVIITICTVMGIHFQISREEKYSFKKFKEFIAESKNKESTTLP